MGISAIRRSAALIAMALTVTACGGFGSGDIIAEERVTEAFDSVDVSGALNVELTVDDSADRLVVVKYDDNVVDRITTEARNGTLYIEVTGGINVFGSDRVVEVTTPELSAISVSGASDLNGSGSVASLDITASGASSVDLRALRAEAISLSISGASAVDVHASGAIVGTASGASDLTIHGNPEIVQVDSSGASDVNLED